MSNGKNLLPRPTSCKGTVRDRCSGRQYRNVGDAVKVKQTFEKAALAPGNEEKGTPIGKKDYPFASGTGRLFPFSTRTGSLWLSR